MNSKIDFKNIFEQPWAKDSQTVSVYLYLLAHMDKENQTHAKFAELERATGIHISQIKRCVRRLEFDKAISMQTKDGNRIYTILDTKA